MKTHKSIKLVSSQLTLLCVLMTSFFTATGQARNSFKPGVGWPDNNGIHINAHGGGILHHEGVYYWFGEHKTEGDEGNRAQVGVHCYSSGDLYNWKDEGVALAVEPNGSGKEIEKDCVIERPKVVYNNKTGTFVMWFHLELKNQGYEAARVGIATSKNIAGPYQYIRSFRPNANIYPLNMPEKDESISSKITENMWTPEWYRAVENGLYCRRDYKTGQMSRDMTLFVDDDGKAYHIYSSEENLTLHIAELTDDYLSHTGKYVRIFPGGHNEAPAIFKRNGRYYMIASGCTGWDPNAARLFTVDGDIMGTWTEFPNPCVGKDADLTFYSQSTYILPVMNKINAYIFMADRWKPQNPITGTYVWLPVQFENGLPVLKWMDEWDLTFFTNTLANLKKDIVLANELLANSKIGGNKGDYSQNACEIFSNAIKEAQQINELATEDEITEAIIALSNAAATFRESLSF